VGTTFGTLVPVLIVHGMAFDPQPLSHLAPWAQQRVIDRLFGIEAT
jgi:hypothetical protein